MKVTSLTKYNMELYMNLILRYLIFVLLASQLSIENSYAEQSSEKTAVPIIGSHPRLILNGNTLERLKSDCRGRSKIIFEKLQQHVDSLLDSPDSYSAGTRQQARSAQSCAMLFLVTGEQLYADAGKRFLDVALDRYIEIEDEEGDGYWEAVEMRRICCFAWDWLYQGLGERERKELGDKILAAGKIAWDKKRFSPYGGGGYGNLDPVFWPAVTLHESGINDSTAAEWFSWTDEKIHQWHKMNTQVASDDGGMYSGLAYAAYNYLRTPIFDFECWKSITGEDLAENNTYLKYFSIWWTYCIKPNGEWPRIDDTGSVGGNISPWHFKYLACRYNDEVSMWLIQNMPEPRVPTVWDIIWNPAGMGINAKGPDSTWPLARHFEGIGWVVQRSGWDSTSTYSIFDCGDFYYGHQHPAENAFTIFRGGSLAINSGRYEWGSDHRPNYMVRTIASNSILVYDPDEKFVANSGDEEVNNGPDGKMLSNDGGQVWPRRQRQTLGDMAGTQWDTGQIIAFETNPYFSYICGDATAGYSKHKLKLFYRQYIHLQPDIFVVFDRVESTQPDFKQYWLLHTVNEPTRNGDWLKANERDGILCVRNILPEKAKVEIIGGEGKEFWVFGKNYPPAITHYRKREGEQWGSWRIQTSPTGSVDKTNFLNVLYAGLKNDNNPPQIKYLGDNSGIPEIEINHQDRIFVLKFNSGERPGGEIIVTDRDGNILIQKKFTEGIQPQSGIGN